MPSANEPITESQERVKIKNNKRSTDKNIEQLKFSNISNGSTESYN